MINKLDPLLQELEDYIRQQDRVVPAVSGGAIGWHIEHCLLTMDAVAAALIQSKPEAYHPKFDIRRVWVMLTGKIPRGRVQAPRIVRPGPVVDAASLQMHLAQTRKGMARLAGLPTGHYFTHPFLGDFRLRPALRFLKVHTKHHLAIISDIARAG